MDGTIEPTQSAAAIAESLVDGISDRTEIVLIGPPSFLYAVGPPFLFLLVAGERCPASTPTVQWVHDESLERLMMVRARTLTGLCCLRNLICAEVFATGAPLVRRGVDLWPVSFVTQLQEKADLQPEPRSDPPISPSA